MYDQKVSYLLDKIIESVKVILQRTETIHRVNDFLDTSEGTLLLDGVCMKLIAIGESIPLVMDTLKQIRRDLIES